LRGDAAFQQRVAIKVIKWEIDSETVSRRREQ
jgi:hypothetical protein